MSTNNHNSAIDSESLVQEIRAKVREVAARLNVENSADFVEDEYRDLYPEVRAAVERGDFKDGYDHWSRYGKAEGRQGRQAAGRNFVAAWSRSYQPGMSSPDEERLAETAPENLSAELSRIELSRSSYQVSRSMLGQAPPGPSTLRGRIGGAMIGAMSKMLWWYTHSIRSSFDALAQKTDAQTGLLRSILNRQAVLENRLAELEASIAGERQFAKFETELEALRQVVKTSSHVEAALVPFETRVSELGVDAQRTREELKYQSRRVSILLEELRRHTPGQAQLPAAVEADIETSQDDQYLAFENIFRGPEQDIKKIQEEYIPYLRERALGGDGMPVLDIGCGRGEWLEALRDHGLTAQGVDSNAKMLEVCRQKGLRVSHSDALSFLHEAADSSFGAITAFHVVEHLPFPKLLAFIDAALRVLRPGGCLVMETPNPENVLVGSYTFYNDPTHIRPLPSGLLRFAVEWRGFVEVELRNLHPYPAAMHFPPSSGIIGERLNRLLYGPQDYAVLARKS
jgi:2-polyprenyl-3-methyl-5-hydroxy-6-metoxy-1,4-benzoquinol methylase